MMASFIRLLRVPVDHKALALLDAVQGRASLPVQVFERDPNVFAEISGSPFAYWISARVRSLFKPEHSFAQGERTAAVGLQTSDDLRFLRAQWEVTRGEAWVPFAKGGESSPFYADIPLVVHWSDSGRILKAKVAAEHGNWSKRVQNEPLYGRPGLTWPLRGARISSSAVPARAIFSVAGKMAFAPQNELLAMLALFNSAPFDALILTRAGETQVQYEVGLIQHTPVPDLRSEDRAALATLARRAWAIRRGLDTSNETSHAFTLPASLNSLRAKLSTPDSAGELASIRHQIDDRAFMLYGIDAGDRAAIEMSSGECPAPPDKAGPLQEGPADLADGESVSLSPDPETLASWCVGVAFGRFDPRLATGERAIPPEPEPFDPLPARSPGMWPADEQQDPPPPPILLDDAGHKLDLAAQVTAVALRVSSTVPETLRPWLAHEFFPMHIKMYSKSRRKAPIYWQLATPSASYSVWLYLHAFTKDTLYQAQKHVDDKLDHEQRQLERMRSELGPGPNAAGRTKFDAQGAFVDELRAMLQEVQRVAPLWSPSLDDGVLINFAPLHRLVPQNKSWQQELRTTWAALAKGEYDWAHLAMHLWPERVVPRCATDRSLAIAHGLEEVFWSQGADKKWKPRTAPTHPVDDLVRDRTSAAVKAALKSLEEAPVAGGGAKKPKSGKKRK